MLSAAAQEIKYDSSYDRALVSQEERKKLQNTLCDVLPSMSLPLIKLVMEYFSYEDFERLHLNFFSHNCIAEMQREVEVKRTERWLAAVQPYLKNVNVAALILNYTGSLYGVDDVYQAYGLNNYEEEKDDCHLAESKKCIEFLKDEKKSDIYFADKNRIEVELQHIAYNAAKLGHLKTLQYLYVVQNKLLTSEINYEYEAVTHKVRLLLVAIKAEQRTLARWLLELYKPDDKGLDGRGYNYDYKSSMASDLWEDRPRLGSINYNYASLAFCIYMKDYEFAYGLLNKGVKPSIGPVDNFKMLPIFSLFSEEAKKENDEIRLYKMEISKLFKSYLNPESLLTKIKNRSWRHYGRAMAVYKALCCAESSTEMLEIVISQEFVLRKRWSPSLDSRFHWLDIDRVTNPFSDDDAFCKILLRVSAILNPNDRFNCQALYHALLMGGESERRKYSRFLATTEETKKFR